MRVMPSVDLVRRQVDKDGTETRTGRSVFTEMCVRSPPRYLAYPSQRFSVTSSNSKSSSVGEPDRLHELALLGIRQLLTRERPGLRPQHDELVARQVASASPVYQHCYWQGHELVDGHVRGDPKRFRELLTARVVPADLGVSRPAA